MEKITHVLNRIVTLLKWGSTIYQNNQILILSNIIVNIVYYSTILLLQQKLTKKERHLELIIEIV